MAFHSVDFNDFDTLLMGLEAHLSSEQEHHQTQWRLTGLLRSLRALKVRTAPADRAALLRQISWWLNNVARIPKVGLPFDPTLLASLLYQRFKIQLIDKDTHWMLRLADLGKPTAWPPRLHHGLKLDTTYRRPPHQGSSDGALLRLSQHQDYRVPTQKAAIRTLTTMPPGGTLLLTMPTGAGKSLLFQLGVRWWREQDPDHPACAIVIVPTVSLALDHVQGLQKMPGLSGCRALTGATSTTERQEIEMLFARGEIPLLIMNPETAFHSASGLIKQVCSPREERLGEARAELAAIFVDEAHIIETWGRTFRPDFQRLISLVSTLRHTNPALRVVLLSATIGETGRAHLRRDYSGHGDFLEMHARVARYEIDLFIRKYNTEAQRDQVLFEVLDRLPRPLIIYTTTRQKAQDIRTELLEKEYGAVALFTGETGATERDDIIRKWRDDALDIVVATSAFGMGIDKPDVRAVIHACLPEDAARYYQEVGRGGRDGHRAIGVCLWTEADARQASRMGTQDWLSERYCEERWRSIVESCQAQRNYTTLPTGDWRYTVDLNIAPRRLGPHTGQHNRNWNRSLMNLMQRAGAITVSIVNESVPSWKVDIHDHRLLELRNFPEELAEDEEEKLAQSEVFKDIFAVRKKERGTALAAFQEFYACLEGDLCMLGDIFIHVESEPDFMDCGHCGPCLERQEPAVDLNHLHFSGLTEQWDAPVLPPERAVLPGVVLVEHTLRSCTTVLQQATLPLARSGYVQFVVPNRRTRRCAEHLQQAVRHPGLVLGFGEWGERKWSLLRCPTVLVLEPHTEDSIFQNSLLRQLLKQPKANRYPLLIIAPRGQVLDARALNQWVDMTYAFTDHAAWGGAGDEN